MCARFTLTAPPNRVAELFDLDLPFDILPRYNIAPTQNVLVVRHGEGQSPEFAMLRWGLVPSWAADLKIGQKLLNARSETVGEKPAFRAAIRKRRCLIPADGFYEWTGPPKQRQPYHIRRPDRAPIAFAGIWERWQSPEGMVVGSCSILTTGANSFLRPLHDRMPVIIARSEQARWLDPSVDRVEALQDLFVPPPDDLFEMQPVSREVNNPRYQDPVF